MKRSEELKQNERSAPTIVPSQIDAIRALIKNLQVEIEALESKVLTDDLTGLLRRNAYAEKSNRLLIEAARSGRNVGVLMIDVDHFKRINDTRGHAGGDEVLRTLAAYLKQFEGPSTVVGRFGGEEFSMSIVGSEREVEATAEMIRRGVEMLGCTVSIGLAHTNQVGFFEDNLVEAADAALYAAKNAGRNQVKRAA